MHLNRVSHAISHHPMPNTEWDLEILGHEPWLYNMVARPANKWVVLYGPLLCCSGHLLDVLFTWARVLRRQQRCELEMLSNPLQLAALCWGCGVATGCAMFALMFLVFGGIDSYAGYPLHHTEEAWTVGDTAHARKRDLAEHILAATVDYDGKLAAACSLRVWRWLTMILLRSRRDGHVAVDAVLRADAQPRPAPHLPHRRLQPLPDHPPGLRADPAGVWCAAEGHCPAAHLLRDVARVAAWDELGYRQQGEAELRNTIVGFISHRSSAPFTRARIRARLGAAV